MGTGPVVTAGHDLGVTELLDGDGHRLVVEAASEQGRAVLGELTVEAGVSWREATAGDGAQVAALARRSEAAMTRHLDPVAARAVLAGALEHPHWDDVASRCLSCTSCTLVCPTCFCTSLGEAPTLDGSRSDHVQQWASCFTLEHSYLHGSGSVRADTRTRYRQWLTHKLCTWWDQFGQSGCVGCGRCITWCPAGIDLTEEVPALAGGPP